MSAPAKGKPKPRVVPLGEIPTKPEYAITKAGAFHQSVTHPRPRLLGKDFATLVYLLSESNSSSQIVGNGKLRYNLLTHRLTFNGIEVTDGDYPRAKLELERLTANLKDDGKPIKWSLQDVADGLTLVAQGDCYDPLAEFFDALPAWDKSPRIDDGLSQALGINFLADGGPIQATYLKRWLVSAVARALEPGVKADAMLVLTGPQGYRKSSFLRSLFGDEWVHESGVDLSNKDGQAVMGRFWCLEWPELVSMRRKEMEAVKHFLSTREDTYRPPYGRNLLTVKRRAVVCGTTNEDDFLQDPTGHRRFWVVRVTRKIATQWVEQNRQQLWAEALHLYRSKEQVYLTDDEATEHVKQSDEFIAADDWESEIRHWLEGRTETEFRLSDILEKCLDMPVKLHDRTAYLRVAKAVTHIGLIKGHTKTGKVWKRGDPSK